MKLCDKMNTYEDNDDLLARSMRSSLMPTRITVIFSESYTKFVLESNENRI